MLAALKAVEAARAPNLGYEVVINSDEEVGSLGSAALIAEAARGKKAALTYEPSALPTEHWPARGPGSGNFSITSTGAPLMPAAIRRTAATPSRGSRPRAAARGKRHRADGESGEDRRRQRRTTSCPTSQSCASTCVRDAGDSGRRAGHDRRGDRGVATEHDVQIHVHGGFARPPKPIDARSRSCSSWSSGPAPISARPSAGSDRRRLRRQQHRRLRRAGGRHDGRARRRDPQHGGISDRREPDRARGIVRADNPAPCAEARELPGPAGERRRFRRHLRDGEADRRRLHQSAAPTSATLVAKLARSDASFARDGGKPDRRSVRLRARESEGGQIRGTCQVFGQVGVASPSIPTI